MAALEVKRYGVSADPMAIVVKYIDLRTSKVMHHRVQLRDIGDQRATAEKIMRRHAEYFESKTIVAKLLAKLADKVRRKEAEEKLRSPVGWKKGKVGLDELRMRGMRRGLGLLSQLRRAKL